MKIGTKTVDNILNSVTKGGFVFWEEVARDGAQSKTILSKEKRVEIALKHAEIFNGFGHHHLIFAAGFPSAGNQEFQAVEYLSDHVDSCYLATHGRPTREDVALGIKALKNAKYGRVTFLLPVTQRMSEIILKTDLETALTNGLDLIKFAKDLAPDMPLDIALVDSPNAQVEQLAEFINEAESEGLSIAKICDSKGVFYPAEVEDFFSKLMPAITKPEMIGVHFHNDLGLALWNIIEAAKMGVRIGASSWLGLGERSGLVQTEILTFLLGYEPLEISRRLGIKHGDKLFNDPLNFKLIPKLAGLISGYLKIPISSVQPLVGKGVNSISTGLPFTSPKDFHPFNPEDVLGISPTVEVTHLASSKVVKYVSLQQGFDFNENEIKDIVKVIKERPYELGESIVSDAELKSIFEITLKKR